MISDKNAKGMKTFSILHISDIHKCKEVSYAALLSSLKKDFEHYNEEGILLPSFIVVSGDLIQGAYDEQTIRMQYEEVEEFLINLCDLVLNKDRSRMIIVPGNHDVNRCVTKESMQLSQDAKQNDKLQWLKQNQSVRWSWDDYQFYKIIDEDKYNIRFKFFEQFYNHFYDGIREYPKNAEREAFFETFDKYKISFAGFNSCCQLDHLCDVGKISESALISIDEQLKNSYNKGYLNIGVWHHNYYGAPICTNYMDRHILDDMIHEHVHVGLYGHQHYAQVANEHIDMLSYGTEEYDRILLISSGTLFGNEKEIPTGCKRQYNIITINIENGNADVSINVREDINQVVGAAIPYWKRKLVYCENNAITLNVKLKYLNVDSLLRQIDRDVRKDGDYKNACERLLEIGIDGELERGLFMSYLKEVKDYEYVFQNLLEVRNANEAFLKIMAVKQLENPRYIQEVKNDPLILQMDDPLIIKELKKL